MSPINILFAGIGILCITLSVPLIKGWVKPNHWYGVRLPATLKDSRIWYPANRFGGKLLLVYGMVVLGAALLQPLFPKVLHPVLSEQLVLNFMVIILLSGAVLILILSWRYARMMEVELEQNGED